MSTLHIELPGFFFIQLCWQDVEVDFCPMGVLQFRQLRFELDR